MSEKKEYKKTFYDELPSREFVILLSNDKKLNREVSEALLKMLTNKGSDLTTDGMLRMQSYNLKN